MLEVSATSLGLVFLILLIRENIWCWLFGAVSSVLSILLFYYSHLYAEAVLYIYYVIMAGYGYCIWSRPKGGKSLKITDYTAGKNLKMIFIAVVLGLGLGCGLSKWSDADLPFIDSQTTMFSFVATYLEAHKILSGWIFWIVVNAATIGLYAYKGLIFYSGLMVIYLGLSFYGYFEWKRLIIRSKMI